MKTTERLVLASLFAVLTQGCGKVLGVDLDEPPPIRGDEVDASRDGGLHDGPMDVSSDPTVIPGEERADEPDVSNVPDALDVHMPDGTDHVIYPPPTGNYDTLTQRATNARLGAVYDDTLKPQTFAEGKFGFLFSIPTLGRVHAQVLYAEGVPGATPSDRFFFADDRNNVYAYNRSGSAPSQAWQRNLGPGWSGSIPDGIIGTPVIAPDKKKLYLVSHQDDGGTSRHYVYVLDTDNGNVLAKVEVAASIPGSGNSNVADFSSAHELQEAALTLVDGLLFVGFAAADDDTKSRGWILAYDVSSTAPHLVSAFITTPNRLAIDTPCGSIENHGSVSQGGSGLVADGSGSLFFQVGKGAYESSADANGFRNVGNAVVRVDPSLKLANAWGKTYDSDTHVAFESCDSKRVKEEAPWAEGQPHSADFLTWSGLDLGSAGPLPLPANKLLVGGSEGFWFLLDRRFNSTDTPAALRAAHNGQIGVPTIADVAGFDQFESGRNTGDDFASNWPRLSTPVYWGDADGGTIYVWGTKDYLRAYHYSATGGVASEPVGLGLKRAPRDARTAAVLTVSGVPGAPPIVWASTPLDHDYGHGRRYGGILRAVSGAAVGGTLAEPWSRDERSRLRRRRAGRRDLA
jgi:hypothetical protein